MGQKKHENTNRHTRFFHSIQPYPQAYIIVTPLKTTLMSKCIVKTSWGWTSWPFFAQPLIAGGKIISQLSYLRWLGTVVTSHTASNRQAYTPVMSMLQKAVQSIHCKSHCTSCYQPAHTNVIMLYAVKCSLYVVGPFLCRTLHKSWSRGGENVTKLLGVPKRSRWHMNFFRWSLCIVHKLSWDKKLQNL